MATASFVLIIPSCMHTHRSTVGFLSCANQREPIHVWLHADQIKPIGHIPYQYELFQTIAVSVAVFATDHGPHLQWYQSDTAAPALAERCVGVF